VLRAVLGRDAVDASEIVRDEAAVTVVRDADVARRDVRIVENDVVVVGASDRRLRAVATVARHDVAMA